MLRRALVLAEAQSLEYFAKMSFMSVSLIAWYYWDPLSPYFPDFDTNDAVTPERLAHRENDRRRQQL
jgi:hypothetical protein